MAIEITNHSIWKPVQIRMTFDSPQELAVFVEILNKSLSVAEAIKYDDTYTFCSTVAEQMDSEDIKRTIDGICDVITWNQLRDLIE